jgi:hypothetical protein
MFRFESVYDLLEKMVKTLKGRRSSVESGFKWNSGRREGNEKKNLTIKKNSNTSAISNKLY